MVFGGEDDGVMAACVERATERNHRMKVAEGPERGENDSHRQSTV